MTAVDVEGRTGRLDVVLAAATGLPRADVQRAIASGRVTVDGVVRPKSFRLEGGERVEAHLEEAAPPPESGGVPVRHDDRHLMVVVKPAGMVTHPTRARREGTLVNRLLGMGVPLSTTGGAERPGIVHRLDAGTSGLLVVAKDDETHEALAGMLSRREIERTYLALVRGHPSHDEFAIEAALGRRGARVIVRHGGVQAETWVKVRERLENAAFLEVRPRTGRTHQIRVHLTAIGHPILGDRAYRGGGDQATKLGLDRPFLHAWRLAFTHPRSGEPIEIEEPLPQDLEKAMKRARS